METVNLVSRYLLVVPEYPPETVGGGGVAFEELAKRYMEHGDLLVITGRWEKSRTESMFDLMAPRGALVRVPLLPNVMDSPALRSVLPPTRMGQRLLSQLVETWRPSVAHLHGYGALLVDHAASVLHKERIPYVFTSHGLPVSYAEGTFRFLKTAAYRSYEALYVSRTVCWATAITAVSKTAMPPQRVGVVVPNGVAALPTSLPFDEEQSERRGHRLFACGRIVPSKGFDVLIRAMVRLGEPAECIIAGRDGGALPSLMEEASKFGQSTRARFIGHQDRSEIASLMAWADVVVMSSRQEPFGLVAFEALAAGKRVVATRTGGLADWLDDPALPVLLVAPDDDEALAAGLRSAVRLGPPTTGEARAVHELIETLNWDAIASQYLELMWQAEAGMPPSDASVQSRDGVMQK